ncbi:glycosyltransferase family 4 protein [Rhizobium sp. 'Codium 1']|uniref:glycosyltransferase family 4 protein n=1 Tax=Rhizobium sp. 'Codium 1' TaxID=2940484 RepID=UPI001E34FC84|nr:glycosyltransferase family 4 protein [Rhizobium sp. 'Codium 1']MCC8931476.1 glycosyltransferase family 4 protein [Rhizobium sp. 'Codium 1']
MSRSLIFAYPGDLSLRTGGYAYDRKVTEGLRSLGWTVNLMPLGDGFPVPSKATVQSASKMLSALPDETLVVIDGLAFGVLDAWATAEAARLKIVALVHHPLALETGLSETEQTRLRTSERAALSSARHVIVTSPMTAREISANYGVEAPRITVALPGTARAEFAPADNSVPKILSVGTLSRRKGHDILLSALKSIEDLGWEATIIGSKTLDPATGVELSRRVDELDLTDRVQLAGEVDDPKGYFAGADIFALASRYEGYGMVFAEALSHGLPIVACKAGAVPDVVPADAGILVSVDDADAFGQALRRLLTDPDERQRRAIAARQAGAQLPDWPKTAQIISDTLDRIS